MIPEPQSEVTVKTTVNGQPIVIVYTGTNLKVTDGGDPPQVHIVMDLKTPAVMDNP